MRMQGDQIGRFFANWATFKSGWRFFKEINSPKKMAIFWANFWSVKNRPNFTL
jgi:hypothetical protein